MFKILRPALLRATRTPRSITRTFLSQAYYCDEVWNNRLNSPILQKVNLDILYHELDQRFQKTRQISAVDVDIFANAVKDKLFMEELIDLVHKLRLSADTSNTLNSTGHAVIRALLVSEKVEELLLVLDDRLNYGLFLDSYTANILLDTFWKKKNFTAGALVASQMMLQDDFENPTTISLSLLHCYNYLLNPGQWPQAPPSEEPEEEVKVRVKYLRNPYDDEHFDLKDPLRIIGKTLIVATKGKTTPLHQSLKIIGCALFGNQVLLQKAINEIGGNKLFKEIIDLVPDDNILKKDLIQLPQDSGNINEILEKLVSESVASTSERDIANQCKVYAQWEKERTGALEEQLKRLSVAERLAEIERIKKSLEQKEQKLWFFENEEAIELAIEEHAQTELETKERSVSAKSAEKEEDYIPPEVTLQKNR